MILVVDDNADTGELFLAILRRASLQGHFINRGYKAIDWLSENKPSLVILDVNIPDISGLEILKILKADPKLHDIPVVMHTAMDHAVAEAAKELGAVATLFKGRYTIDEVRATIGQFEKPKGA